MRKVWEEKGKGRKEGGGRERERCVGRDMFLVFMFHVWEEKGSWNYSRDGDWVEDVSRSRTTGSESLLRWLVFT